MAEGLNFKWFYCEGNLPNLLKSIGWEGCGFSMEGIAWVVANGYQLNNENGVLVSMFPIEDEVLFDQTLGAYLTQLEQFRNQTDPDTMAPWQMPPDGQMRIITQEECDTIHTRLLALEAKRQEEMAAVPTEEDIYKAEQLLLLTELCNGVAALQNDAENVK